MRLTRLQRAIGFLAHTGQGLGAVERLRLARLPRYQRTITRVFGKSLTMVDAASFLVEFDEIFGKRVYDFPAAAPDPLIIDCGANIGLATIFWKRLFPASHIIAFEPDPAIFAALESNVRTFGLGGVTLHDRAVWNAETSLEFRVEGGAGGRLDPNAKGDDVIHVPTVRLRDFLTDRVDLLKVDIEGAETEVLADCGNVLSNVEQLFVEYHSQRGRQQTLHVLLALLQAAGFRYHLTPALVASSPFLARPASCGMDLQLNVFAFRD
ncbi:MAG: FkbM family methyltransferase [Thermoanaerobaculales bacterium]